MKFFAGLRLKQGLCIESYGEMHVIKLKPKRWDYVHIMLYVLLYSVPSLYQRDEPEYKRWDCSYYAEFFFSIATLQVPEWIWPSL